MARLKSALVGSLRDDLGDAFRWRPASGKFRLLAAILLVLFALYAAVFAAVTAVRLGGPPSGDFFALWSSGRFAAGHPAAAVYDPAALHAAQVRLGMDPQTDYPFPYPPSFLLVLVPLALLPYRAAFVVAIGLSLAAYVAATVGRRWRSPMTVAALVMPTTTITIAAGQTGFVAAALLAGGCRLAERRPGFAGVLFGLASYKPQLGPLVPLALLAAGLWRSIAAAAATAAALVLASIAIFGWAAWPAWLSSLSDYSREFGGASGKLGHLMPTVTAGLAQIGASPLLADAGQAAAALIAACVVWLCFRRGPSRLAAAALFIATFLATPHAFIYDMPLVATAVLWAIEERHDAHAALGTGEVLVMMLALMAPITAVAGASGFPLTLVSLALLLAVIARRCRGAALSR